MAKNGQKWSKISKRSKRRARAPKVRTIILLNELFCTLSKKVLRRFDKKMLASPRFPIKATILEYLLQTKAFQITTKTMEKQCLKIEQEVGESQEHGRCIGVPLSHLGCHLVLFDPLVWDRHPSFISYNFSSGRPQCPLLLDLHCLNY